MVIKALHVDDMMWLHIPHLARLKGSCVRNGHAEYECRAYDMQSHKGDLTDAAVSARLFYCWQ